jgi:hypothetical protein
MYILYGGAIDRVYIGVKVVKSGKDRGNSMDFSSTFLK